jgi:hypothetical protein
MANWQAVELIEDYWIIIDADTQDEYQQFGINFMFDNKKEANEFIKGLK